jgi:hypothetical protein
MQVILGLTYLLLIKGTKALGDLCHGILSDPLTLTEIRLVLLQAVQPRFLPDFVPMITR